MVSPLHQCRVYYKYGRPVSDCAGPAYTYGQGPTGSKEQHRLFNTNSISIWFANDKILVSVLRKLPLFFGVLQSHQRSQILPLNIDN